MAFRSARIVLLILCLSVNCLGQIRAGKIVYERKTNLFKKYKGQEVKEWLKESDKIKIDFFELYFNDSLSAFKPQESDLKEQMSWATAKNSVYQDYNKKTSFLIKPIWGEDVYINDSVITRNWKITDSKRIICGYSCRKAIWNADSVTNIYAWYCDEIIPGIGPETFCGLPGGILGLATEDGGIIYFAKSVEVFNPGLNILIPKKVKGKIYTLTELKAKLQKDFGKDSWGKAMMKNLFGYL